MDKIIICLWCGKEKTIKYYPSRSDRGKYCSRSCVSRAANTGRKSHLKGTKLSLAHRLKLANAHKGKQLSDQHKLNMSRAHKKDIEKHHWWKGGLTTKSQQIKNSYEYKQWRLAVFIRDQYTCQGCGATGVYIEADHIKPKSLYPELMFDINNGRALCKPCHKQTPTYGIKMRKLLV